MKDTDLLREYVSILLTEKGFIRKNKEHDKKPKKAGPGFIDKVKKYFTGTSDSDAAVEEWIENAEASYGIEEMPDTISKSAKAISHRYWPKALARSKNDKDAATRRLQKALNQKFGHALKKLEKELDTDLFSDD